MFLDCFIRTGLLPTMSQSQDVCAASGCAASGSVPKRNLSDENLENMLSGALEQAAAEDGKMKDVVSRYHEMMRRTLVDWGDEIFDLVAARFADAPKTVAQIELVRKETIDPLRP